MYECVKITRSYTGVHVCSRIYVKYVLTHTCMHACIYLCAYVRIIHAHELNDRVVTAVPFNLPTCPGLPLHLDKSSRVLLGCVTVRGREAATNVTHDGWWGNVRIESTDDCHAYTDWSHDNMVTWQRGHMTACCRFQLVSSHWPSRGPLMSRATCMTSLWHLVAQHLYNKLLACCTWRWPAG